MNKEKINAGIDRMAEEAKETMNLMSDKIDRATRCGNEKAARIKRSAKAGLRRTTDAVQETVDRTAERVGRLLGSRFAIDPIGEERGHDAVADAKARDLRPDGQDFAGAIGTRDDRRLAGTEIFPVRDHQVTIVERYGMDTHLHFMRSGRSRYATNRFQSANLLPGLDLIRLHLNLLGSENKSAFA